MLSGIPHGCAPVDQLAITMERETVHQHRNSMTGRVVATGFASVWVRHRTSAQPPSPITGHLVVAGCEPAPGIAERRALEKGLSRQRAVRPYRSAGARAMLVPSARWRRIGGRCRRRNSHMNIPGEHSLESEQRHEPTGPEAQGSPSGDVDTMSVAASGQHMEAGVGSHTAPTPLRDLLAVYDREVEDALLGALESTTGLDRVRVLHNTLRRSISVHDAVLMSALCPHLEDLPGGSAVAQRLRQGCEERAELLGRFEAVSHNVAARNVYPVSGEEIERILEGLERSFAEHVRDETIEVGGVLEAAAGSSNPDVVAAKMAIEAEHAPTRTHVATVKHPRSAVLKTIYRYGDRFHDWSDSHWGWSDPQATRKSPRAQQVDLLKSQPTGSPPSIRDLLTGYDATVEELIVELRSTRTGLEQAEAAYRLNAAIAVHDSVLGGVLCPLLEAVPGGEPLAVRLRVGCHHRAKLQQAWDALTKGVKADDLSRLASPEAEAIIEPLIESFRSHEREESLDVISLLEHLPDSSYRTKTSPFNDVMWPWYSEGPSVLALHMALWAQSGPTHVHPLMVRHPTSRALRTYYHYVDDFRDHWGDSTIGRWLFPVLPSQQFAGKPRQGDPRSAAPRATGLSEHGDVERPAEEVPWTDG